MKVADVYISLGIKGNKDAQKSVKDVHNSVGELKNMAIETKAAILGLVAGLGNLMKNSMQTGVSLDKFANLTGLSMEALQRWQYAMQQSGGSTEDFQNSVESLQLAITKMTDFQTPLAGFDNFSKVTNLDVSRVKETFYLMSKLQEYAQKVKAPDFRLLTDSFLGKDTQSAMIQGTFNAKNLAAADPYTNPEVKKLKAISIEWTNLYTKLEKIIGKLNAEHGFTLIKHLSELSVLFGDLISKSFKLAENMKIFQILEFSTKGWISAFQELNELIEQFNKNREIENPKAFTPEGKSKKEAYNDAVSASSKGGFSNFIHDIDYSILSTMDSLIKKIPGVPQGESPFMNDPNYHVREVEKEMSMREEQKNFNKNVGVNTNITVNQHGIKDTHESLSDFKKEIGNIYKISPIVNGGF